MSTSIKLENVCKSFKIYEEKERSVFNLIFSFNKSLKNEKLNVINSISLEVKKGEVLGIMGRNGSGKTTLLKLIAGILKPDKGRVTTQGEIIPFLDIGTGFNGELTAIDNIILYGIIMGFTKNSIKKRVSDVLKYAELERFAGTKLKHFSAGMYARLAFSVAIQADPDILLVDEVLAVGDMDFRRKSFETFSSFKDKKRSIILVSHDSIAIKELCDRLVIIEKGKIAFDGNVEEGIRFYENLMNRK